MDRKPPMRETDGAGPGALDKGTGEDEEGRPGCPPLAAWTTAEKDPPRASRVPAQRPALPAVPLTPHLGVAQGRGFYILIDTPPTPPQPCSSPLPLSRSQLSHPSPGQLQHRYSENMGAGRLWADSLTDRLGLSLPRAWPAVGRKAGSIYF